jgi:hypothetical protein
VVRLALLCSLVGLLACTGCGNSGRVLSEADIRASLERLPFQYSYRDVSYSGEGAVVAGSASVGRHKTYFAVISGNPKLETRAVPRQRRPDGSFQHGVDSTRGPGYLTQFVYTRTSIPRLSDEIDSAICSASGGGSCTGV